MNNRWVSKRNTVYNISYHIVWIPKYRKHLLKGLIKDRLIEILYEKSDKIGVQIKAIECMNDHIHLFIKTSPVNSIPFIVKSLKGYSSFVLRKEFSLLRKFKHMWTNSYFCETIGFISEDTVKKYISNQINHHKIT